MEGRTWRNEVDGTVEAGLEAMAVKCRVTLQFPQIFKLQLLRGDWFRIYKIHVFFRNHHHPILTSLPDSLHSCTASECQTLSFLTTTIFSRDVSLVDETQCREYLNTSISAMSFSSAVSFRLISSRVNTDICPNGMQFSVDPAGLLPYRARGMLQTFLVEP